MIKNVSPGMGQAVAERTIFRKLDNGQLEVWNDVAQRVALGNSLLAPPRDQCDEYDALYYHIAEGHTVMSGRHLQHGDADQPSRPMEVFTNCATSATSFAKFYLMLNGAGVGRCYDDDLILVNWDNAPSLRCVIDSSHKDFDYSAHESLRDAQHKYGNGPNTIWFEVPDSREGWGKALELWETLAFEKIHRDRMLILDFSKVRPEGSPIRGMQNRPSSGPVPLMNSFQKAASLKGSGLAPWKQAIYIDHYFAECVRVGGARRAARMSTKHWADPTIFDFIAIKRPIEYRGLNINDVMQIRSNPVTSPLPFLWSSNNSVAVDEQFWEYVRLTDRWERDDPLIDHAKAVFKAVTESAYADGTGEPGFINVDKLVQKDEGWTGLNTGEYLESTKYQVNEDTQVYLSKLAKRAKKKKYHTIVNPCGEIALNVLGGFCVIADGVPFHCDSLDDAEDMFRTITRSLIRVNSMNSIYQKEVERTNRIGVAITGIHEFAYKFFGYGFRDLIDEEKSKDFWLTMARFNRAVTDEAIKYSYKLGMVTPHTMTTIKPSGTVSKLFMLTEGWHLPSMREYIRWVQFKNDDPLVKQYQAAGYPSRELVQYDGTTIIGFPTRPTITTLEMGDKLVTAAEATPEEQFKWLMLGEKYWIKGTDPDGIPLTVDYGNQISYTLKYDPKIVSLHHFQEMLLEYQSQVRCCSVMPQEEIGAYEYSPEQPVSSEEYMDILWRINSMTLKEDIGMEHVECEAGGCPIDFNEGEK